MGAYIALALSPRFPGVQFDAQLAVILLINIAYSFRIGIDTR